MTEVGDYFFRGGLIHIWCHREHFVNRVVYVQLHQKLLRVLQFHTIDFGATLDNKSILFRKVFMQQLLGLARERW